MANKKKAPKPAAKPADDIEAQADAAAAADPAPEPEVDTAPVEAAPAKAKQPEAAPATERQPQTQAKPGGDTAASQAHLAAKLESRTLSGPEKAPKPSKEAQAKIQLRAETRARLDEIKEALAELEEAKRELIDEQQLLANPVAEPDGMSFIERLRQVQSRTTENRQRRHNDRLKLLAAAAGKSPLDKAMGEGKRKSPADADVKE